MVNLGDRLGVSTFAWLFSTSKAVSVLLLATISCGYHAKPLKAQSIIEANDGVGTRVEEDQNIINIDGGTQAGNNLFHSFEQFGLSESQTAIFLSNPEIVNILGRVVGNEASIIDGLLQVNNDANLFLMNPAGVIFGENAQLNVGGDFTATTATGIGFGDGNFFNVYDDSDFSTLTGTPFQFAFDAADADRTPGAIINTGNLTIERDLTLIGGSVVSTGTVSSSQGNVTVSTVPNSSSIAIEQEGSLLSLEIDPPRDINGAILPFGAVDLPELLTGNLLVNEVAGENVTLQANEGSVFVGTDLTFESSSFLPEIDLFDGNIAADRQIFIAGEEVSITDGSSLTAESVNLQPKNRGLDSSDRQQSFEGQIANEGETDGDRVVGVDLDGDGLPDLPVGVISENSEVDEPSEEVISLVNSEVENVTDSATVADLQQLANTTIAYQPENLDPQALLERQITTLDERFSQDYQDFYALNEPDNEPTREESANDNADRDRVGSNLPNQIFVDSEEELEISLAQIQQALKKIEEATGAKPAVIYAAFYPPELSLSRSQKSILPQPDDELELVAVTADKEPVRRRVEGADRTEVEQIASRFADSIFYGESATKYLPPSQQLYQWLVEPLGKDLKTREIDNLVFILESGIRSIPFAALHDGEQFLVENYSVGMMPSFRLTNTIYQDIRDVELLAMGSDTFADPQLSPLPAVPVELEIVVDNLWDGESFLNQDFTVDNLKQTQNKSPFGILHLATHAEFLPGKPSNSYIQFGDRKLRLNEVRELGLNNPLVELIVLSACKTAVGDPDAEYGFASLAYQAGVKSALGSLWYVSDSGTLALMSKFYGELKDSPIKAEALRRAQVAMIEEKVRLKDGKLIADGFEFDLPPEISEEELTHPRYWSPFAIVGNPW